MAAISMNSIYPDMYNSYGDSYEMFKKKRLLEEVQYIPALCNNSTEVFEKLCGIKNIIRDINKCVEEDSKKTLSELLKSGSDTFNNVKILNLMLECAFDGLANVLLKIVEEEELKNETK